MTILMIKALIKRSADAMEKLGIGSLLFGLFKSVHAGIVIGTICLGISYWLTSWEVRI